MTFYENLIFIKNTYCKKPMCGYHLNFTDFNVTNSKMSTLILVLEGTTVRVNFCTTGR